MIPRAARSTKRWSHTRSDETKKPELDGVNRSRLKTYIALPGGSWMDDAVQQY